MTGADEHVRRRAGADRFVTVIADPAPVRERRGPSRTRGIVTGHFKKTLKTWLAGEPDSWKAGIEVVAMDGIGWAPRSAASEELPGSVPVMDPLHAHQRAQALDECRQRARRQIRGRKGAGQGTSCTGRSAPSSLGPPCSHPIRQDRRRRRVRPLGPYRGGIDAKRLPAHAVRRPRHLPQSRGWHPAGPHPHTHGSGHAPRVGRVRPSGPHPQAPTGGHPHPLSATPTPQRPHQSHGRALGTPQEHCPGIPQPNPLPTPRPPRNRRSRTPPTP